MAGGIKMKNQSFRIFIAVVFLAISALSYLPEANADEGPIEIGSRRELFVDDFLIEKISGGTKLTLHHPIPQEVVMVHDEPWEGSGSGYHTIFRDGNKYRMYYKAWQLTVSEGKLTMPHDIFIAYAESEDGSNWVKPELGLFEFEGSKKNNIIWMGTGSHGFTPFKDTSPDCRPDAGYKAVGAYDDEGGGLFAFKSPDGIRWSLVSDEPVMTKGAFDSQNLAFRDEVRGEYRAYVRDFRDGVRGIRTATSSDFVTWTEPEWLVYPGTPDEPLYTNQIKPYDRAPHIFVGFPSRYIERVWTEQMKALPGFEHRKLRASASPRYGSAITDALFMSSRDGITFKRWGEAFLRPGLRNKDNWAYGDNYIAWHAVTTRSGISDAPDELSIYATESYWTGTSNRLRRFTIRMDGFVSLRTPLAGGEIVTRPIKFSGRALEMNFATSAAGVVLVEIQDDSGNPIRGFSLDDCLENFGDDLQRTVLWKNGSDVSRLSGKPIRLRFVMKDADLYSMKFR